MTRECEVGKLYVKKERRCVSRHSLPIFAVENDIDVEFFNSHREAVDFVKDTGMIYVSDYTLGVPKTDNGKWKVYYKPHALKWRKQR